MHKEADATLESKINFAEIVKLPPDEELEDFIAFHVVDFYNRFLAPTVALEEGILSVRPSVRPSVRVSGLSSKEH